MGCIRAVCASAAQNGWHVLNDYPKDNICVKGNKKGVVIREFGLLQLCGQPMKAVQENLPWCSPEVIRASRIMQQSLETHLVCTTESDIYSYGSFSFSALLQERKLMSFTQISYVFIRYASHCLIYIPLKTLILLLDIFLITAHQK